MNIFISKHGYEFTKMLEQLHDIQRIRRFRESQILSLDYKQVAMADLEKVMSQLSKQELSSENRRKKIVISESILTLNGDIVKIKAYLSKTLPSKLAEKENEILIKIQKKTNFHRVKIFTSFLPAYVTALNLEKKRKQNMNLFTSFMGTNVDAERALMNRSFLAKPKMKTTVKKSDSFQFDDMQKGLINSVTSESSYMSPNQKEALVSIGEALAVLSKSDNNEITTSNLIYRYFFNLFSRLKFKFNFDFK